MAALNIAKDIL